MYQCLTKPYFEDESGYQLVTIRAEDLENIRLWRNAQLDILRQKVNISTEEQQNYFQKVIWPTFKQPHPPQLLFSFLLDQTCIGYGGLVHLDWENARAEVSFLVDPSRINDQKGYKKDFLHFLNLICQIAFQELNLHRLCVETFAFRKEHIAVLEHFGFKQEGVLREHIFKRQQWQDSLLHGLLAHEWSSNRLAHFAVLVTSISKKMPLLEAVRAAAHQISSEVCIHGCDSQAFCMGQYGVDEFWHCPVLEELTPEQVAAYCRQHRITALIPTRDDDLEFYARHRLFFAQQGLHAMVSPLETILMCLDKKHFAEFLLKENFPAIPTYLSLDACESATYVVKERRGAGSRSLGINLSRLQAEDYSQHLKQPIFQPYVKGQEWSVDLYRSFEGKVKGCVARQRNYVVNGESQVTTTVHCAALEKLCQEMADALQIQGHAVFQVMEDAQGNFHVIECNPRFGGASTASLAVGLDSFYWFFIESEGFNLEDYPFLRREDIRQIRYPKDQVLPWSSSLT